jgi:hypothetical protein
MVYVVNDGLEYIARYITQSTVGYFSWLALDAGATVEAAGTTALASEIVSGTGGARKVATVSYEASYKAVWTATYSFSGNLAIKGCGVFNQLALGGKLLMCHAFAADKNVESGETMQLTMKLTMSR